MSHLSKTKNQISKNSYMNILQSTCAELSVIVKQIFILGIVYDNTEEWRSQKCDIILSSSAFIYE